ncbi:MAG: alpha/beta hydrolase [Burkholderiales bacterium]|nr:alpha/beta hydrolase [Burkholderiales bacterium]
MNPRETVILVHGLWVHGVLMTLMRQRIARAGYRAISYSYPTLRLTLAENAARLACYCRGIDATRLHFVGHSMGGLVILRMLEEAHGLDVGRIVLAGTPYADSFAAHRLARLPGGRTILGRSMPEWLTSEKTSVATRYEIGVIAGSLGVGLGRVVAPDLPWPNDGVVTVEETRVPGARDHIVLDVNHTGMLVSAAVARQACAFLKQGAFVRSDVKN